MAKKTSTSIFESFASIILPEGILYLFEVTHVEEEHIGNMDETGTEVRVIHIYLDEHDERQKEWHDLQPNDFTEPPQNQ